MSYQEKDPRSTLSAQPTLDIASLIRQAQAGKETVLDITRDVLADGEKKIKLAIGHRQLQPEQAMMPIREPSPARNHIFHDVGGFSAYINKYGSDKTVVLADPAEEMMVAVLDETAKDQFESIRFVPLSHPTFAPWEQLLEATSPIPIKAFVDFIARNRRSIVAPDGRELLLQLGQIRISRKVEIYQGERTNSINGVMVETNVQGGKGVYVDIPEIIHVEVPIYVGTESKTFEVDITLLGTEEHGALVRVTAGDLINAKTQLFESFIENVRKLTSETKITLGLGKADWTDWTYLKAE
jgi:hypothetical protein